MTNTVHSFGHEPPMRATFALGLFYSGQGGTASVPFTGAPFTALSAMDPFATLGTMDPFAAVNSMDPFNSEGHE